MHLPSIQGWRGLAHNPNVRVALLPPNSLAWPWECLHYEALAWYDHWLKGHDTGIMEGPPIRYAVPEADGWRTSAAWPPPESKLTAFALRADGVLAEDEGPAGSRAYIHLPQIPDGRGARIFSYQLLTWETAPITETVLS